ncbi:hypothetical protein OC846_004064 [Tilletia horrida]|uniref:Protein kinase domain-containing protein n=1 Tax=Tilletia horrida TaxID=155126 RepID=A0AAN6GPD1_9BASI|nr:hypothetical protein OC846_004064 [Tilletia horrida]KAK0564684.1 hypothetical protein OC861_004157 [Tilletia horrida]
MLEREPCRNNQRMKVSWVREVEVLKHISHPSLIHLLRSFCTPTYNILVLECVPGGELFDLVAQSHLDVIAPREWLVRRIVGELASAIGWMHRVNLVHRDIKLENIILTKDLRTRTPLDPASLPLYAPAASASSSAYPEPLVKLTDFGLSRFIDPDTPHLETRCGSEEYAAPELIMGRRYDGRQTDAWALGVVVYALLTGSLPFLEDLPGSGTMNSGGMEASGSGRSSGQISAPLRETSANANGTRTVESASAPGSGAEAVVRDPRARKAHLLRIAKGDLRWPSPRNELCQDDFGREDTESMQDSASAAAGLGIQGQKTRNRLITPQAQAFVSRLLKRDPTKRATVWQVWDEEWLLTGSFGSAQSNTTESAPGAVDVGQRLSRTQLVAESSALDGNLLELPVDPRSEQGREWLDAYTMLRTEPLSAVARDD